MIELDPALLTIFRDNYPYEECALMIGTRERITDLIWVPNRSTKAKSHFIIAKVDVEPWQDVLVGPMHTHPTGSPDPSYHDVVSLPRGMLGAVFQPRRRVIAFYDDNGFIETRGV